MKTNIQSNTKSIRTRRAWSALALALAALGLSLPAVRAADVTVLNPSFEAGSGEGNWTDWSVPGGWGRLSGN
jgi:hypothetical protein